jgi:flagellin
VAFTINTNIASLQAQDYLRVTSDFQSKTINRVTSGLRIVSSGDDAAGLAIANGFRSDQAVLAQGVRNANDGLSTLQTIDGGISNISKLLDRARTLATQSASGTFTGDRSVLNDEFQSVMAEIDRQAQAIGLSSGGAFAKNLQVFVGGGRGDNADEIISNGTVSVDLSSSTVDSTSLGLKGYTVSGVTDLDLSATFSAAKSAAGSSFTFKVSGPGFTDDGTNTPVDVTVNLSNVNDLAGLVDAINAGIEAAASGNSASAVAFKNAGLTASISSDGKSFTLQSASGAFIVNDNASAGTDAFFGTALAGSQDKIAQGVQSKTFDFTANTDASSQVITVTTVDDSGAMHTKDITIGGAIIDATDAVQAINDALQTSQDPYLKGIVAAVDGSGTNKISFASSRAFSVVVGEETGGTVADELLGSAAEHGTTVTSAANGSGSTLDISNASSAQAAVTALGAAVTKLGQAQAVVGKGQNQFNYAVNLAQSQISNMAAAESRIRDADLAAEAANMTKAQILLQAGIAALAQANSAPQQVLALLRG